MKRNIFENLFFLSVLIFFIPFSGIAQKNDQKGALFIIGGGERPDYLMEKMISIAKLEKEDYIVILPMASKNPKKATQFLKKELEILSDHKVYGLDFNESDSGQRVRTDSVANAKLIYVLGGSQRRFMNIVRDTPLEEAIYEAYENGATIGGTSAGAAIMSEVMITGQHTGDLKTRSFNHIRRDSVKTEKGLGLLPYYNIIDQHFLIRSRFNRLISIMGHYPTHQVIGIDESTAVIYSKGKAEVVGESQVVVMSNPIGLSHPKENLIRFKNVEFALYGPGDIFELK